MVSVLELLDVKMQLRNIIMNAGAVLQLQQFTIHQFL
jgi:hypothetical protein